MTTTLAIAATILGISRLAMFIGLHLVDSEFNLVEHAVSDYAVGPTRRLTSIMTWTTAAFWIALAAATVSAFPDWDDLVGVTIRLTALAIIFVALPFLPTDVEGTLSTTTGRLHMVAAIAWFALAYSCIGNFRRFLEPTLPGYLGSTLVVTGWIALISLVALVIALIIRPLRRRAFGISERVFLLSLNVFYIAVAIGIVSVQF